jgi:hypothetical protein
MQVSEQGLRKMLYQKIVAAFPEGWMSSGQISRDGALYISCCIVDDSHYHYNFFSSELDEEEIRERSNGKRELISVAIPYSVVLSLLFGFFRCPHPRDSFFQIRIFVVFRLCGVCNLLFCRDAILKPYYTTYTLVISFASFYFL